MSQRQSSEEHENNSVNVLFRGALPAHLVKDYVVCALKGIMPAQGRVLFHMNNDIKVLSPHHSISVKYWDRNLPSSVEICSFSGVAANAGQAERLLAQQAKHAFNAEDFTVVNFGTESALRSLPPPYRPET